MSTDEKPDKGLPDYNTYPLQTKLGYEEPEWFDNLSLKLFGDFFKKHRESFQGFQKTLNQAQISDGYDLYLSRALLWFLVLAGMSLFIALAATVSVFFVIPNVNTGFTFPAPPEAVMSFVTQVYSIGPFIVGGILTLALTFLMAGIPTLTLYLIPWYRAGEREREIDTMLPYAVTFMYALSRGGANMINVMRTVSKADDVYGEAANEFQMVVTDMQYFDSDLRSALIEASDTSPSQKFSDFIDDLVSIVDTGGNLEAFMFDKTEEFLLEARREQENFLDTLSLMGEIYVTAFVAGPLFIIIIITVMALIGGSSLNMLYIVVYAILPLGNVGFAFLVDVLKSGKTAESTISNYGYEVELEDIEKAKEEIDDDRVEELYSTKRRNDRIDTITSPYQTFRENPMWTLALTVPISMVYYAIMYMLIGIPMPLVENSITITSGYAVGPLMIWLIPISFFHELKTRRQERILRKIPNMLKKLSSANATGMSLEESFDIVAQSTGGEIGDEMRYVKNEIDWRGDLNEALIRFGQRVDTPRLSRTVKLITQASRSTGNITEVIDVASKDVQQTHRLEKDRKQEMAMYTVIIIVSFLVYLLVIVMLNEAFLAKIANLAQEGSGGGDQLSAGGGAGFNLSDMPVNLYNMVFYHSTIIQAFGAGLIAGLMGGDDMLTGLKYSLAMIGVATVVFLLI